MLVPDEETDVGRIDEEKPVLRVVDYVDDLIREQSRVDCVRDTAAPRYGIEQL